ncbi:MAG TPA: hypothetical protein VFH66_04035 [Mycobacteriales bacterium]|nr:hypothetical protein [Mycobacteriales bacterium]
MTARWTSALACFVLAVAGLVAAPEADAAETYTVTVHITASPSAHVGATLTVSGSVTNGSGGVAAATLTIKRTDERTGATETLAPMMTGADGSFSAPDPQPAVWGYESYDVTASDTNGSGAGHSSLWISRYSTTLTITSTRSVVSAGSLAHVTAHLGTTDTNRTVTIYARPYRRDRTQIRSGAVDATNGDLSATYTMERRTRFIAYFAGDQKYRPASAYVVVLARAVVHEHLRGGYATSGKYRLYHSGANPVLAVHMLPELDGVCLEFLAQRYYNGAWHRDAVGCVRTDVYGRAIGVLTGDHHLYSPYRARARWGGSAAVLARTGAWQYLKFRP